MSDPRALLERAARGGRLARDEALSLTGPDLLHDLCAAAGERRRALYGNAAFYVYNQHINFSNICRNACRFCAFSRRPGDPQGYTRSLEEIAAELASRKEEPIREVHVVGGLNPELQEAYYLGVLRTIKAARPGAAAKAFTAVEVAFLAEQNGRSIPEVLARLREAGLDALPGGGAEVFAAPLRRKLCPEKITGEVWLDVHRQAHRLGLPSNATMLFGHIESWEERIDHLLALRDLQDETGGFVCFIPLPYQPRNNPLAARGADGVEFLQLIALSRLVLDNIPHLKAYWPFCGIKAAQMALWAGADDMDGTIVEERIGHAAGADTPTGMSLSQLRRAVSRAGFTPVERGTDFRPV